MDKVPHLGLMIRTLGCIKHNENANESCGRCPYLIKVDCHYYFCDRMAIIEDVQEYMKKMEAMKHADGK